MGQPGFPYFLSLPMEVRLIIWEMTWPEARVIEAAYSESHDHHAEDEYIDCAILRMTCRMSTWLQTDFGPRVLEDSAIEKCANPSALQVCQESRQLTLSKFALMRHGILKDRAFYFRPECDVIWLNTDVTDDIYYQEKLQKYYGQDLGRIESLLVEETEWEGSNMYPGCLGVFGGLRFVDILLDDQSPELMVTDDDTDQDVHVGNDSDDGQPSWTIRYLIRPELGFQGINSVGEPTEASNARE